MKRFFARGTAMVTVGLLALTGATGTASANSLDPGPVVITISDAQEAQIRSQMVRAGIAVDIQDTLLANIEEGVLPMSTNPANEPVDTIVEVLPGVERTISVYEDGSRRVTETERPVEGMAARATSISGCKTSGGWRVNCKIAVTDLVSEARFTVDWYPSSTAAKVRDVRAAGCVNSLGGCTISAGIKRATQSSAGPAWAEASFTANAGPIKVQGAFGVRANKTVATAY